MNMIISMNEILTFAMIVVTLVGIGLNMSRGNISKAISILVVGCVIVALIAQPNLFAQLGKSIVTFVITMGGGINGT